MPLVPCGSAFRPTKHLNQPRTVASIHAHFQQTLADLAIPSSALISASLLDLGTTSTTHATSYAVDASSDAVVIPDPPGLNGDPNELGAALVHGTALVTQGTVTVTDTETTIETHHAELDIVVAV